MSNYNACELYHNEVVIKNEKVLNLIQHQIGEN